MSLLRWISFGLALQCVQASLGDGLPQFKICTSSCNQDVCVRNLPSPEFFDNSINILSKHLFRWDCFLDCNYKCQQIITNDRHDHGLEMVQFFGKWPFRRVVGVTELFSVLFSMANFAVNYISFKKVYAYYSRIPEHGHPKKVAAFQYVILLLVSLFGWVCSTVFHIRDTPLTETLDYLGAGAIIMANFNAIFLRLFGLFYSRNSRRRHAFQVILGVLLLGHYLRLSFQWDYNYNMLVNVVVGLLASILWIIHSLKINSLYKMRKPSQLNSIYSSELENRLNEKLDALLLGKRRLLEKHKISFLPLIPIVLNLFLISSLSLELLEFEPWWRLIDAHALWHFCTIFPPLIWYDWNLWDIDTNCLIDRSE